MTQLWRLPGGSSSAPSMSLPIPPPPQPRRPPPPAQGIRALWRTHSAPSGPRLLTKCILTARMPSPYVFIACEILFLSFTSGKTKDLSPRGLGQHTGIQDTQFPTQLPFGNTRAGHSCPHPFPWPQTQVMQINRPKNSYMRTTKAA